MSKNEFDITNKLLNYLGVEFESDSTITLEYVQITCGNHILSFPEKYNTLETMGREHHLFRPLKSEKHANMLIDMFEESYPSNIDALEISEKPATSKKQLYELGPILYSGFLISKSMKIGASEILDIPSIPALKCAIVAKMLLPDYEHEIFNTKLSDFLKGG